METKTENKPEKKTLTQKISERITEWKERDGVDIGDGFTVSSATARLLREKEGSAYIGTSFVRLCRTVKDGIASPWTPFRPGLAANEEKIVVQEWTRVPHGLNDLVEVYLAQNGGEPSPVGHKISTHVLRKMRDNHALTPTGLEMLAAQIGAEVPAAEEVPAEEAAIAK